ncbi:hypothetical protein [Chryseobacterium sp. OV279]|uniref:hypothetical protein n=1 Tax=Chryseobacterium sp. OV279 TaxID=1500285 RepID=UPI00091C4F9C|nr:hypothetical protein [Chryseobacterium sp. OV279]SHE95472.1 hypothetical protein SAMN02787100_1216 [Chryseobacterium sp. OV279]
MDIKHEKITVQKLIDMYEDIRFIFSDALNIVKSYGYDENKDCRTVFYKLASQATQTNVILFHLIGEHFGDIELWNLQKFADDEVKQNFLRNQLDFIVSDLRENLFVNIFLRFENFIKLIARSQGLNGEKLNKLTKDLIDKLGINIQYKDLVDLVTYIRNTIHTEGFHTKPDVTISYKGQDFELKQNNPVTFYNEDFLHFLISEISEFVMTVINTNDIKSIPLIEHTYVGLNHIYDDEI